MGNTFAADSGALGCLEAAISSTHMVGTDLRPSTVYPGDSELYPPQLSESIPCPCILQNSFH